MRGSAVLKLFAAVAVVALTAMGVESLRSTQKAPSKGGQMLEVFAGSASQPATTEAVRLFEVQTGIQVRLHFGGSGKMLSELSIVERGDVYFPGSSDYMTRAIRGGVVEPDSVQRIAFLLPALNVPKGNPQGIRSLEDLARPNVRVGLARPDTVCVGLYGVETLHRSRLWDLTKPQVNTYTESCAKAAQLVSLGLVDAVLGWAVFQHWDPEHIETIYLDPEQVPRIGYLPAGVTRFAAEPDAARDLIEFLQGTRGREIFERWGYLTTEEQIRRHTLPETPVGGEWALPADWR